MLVNFILFWVLIQGRIKFQHSIKLKTHYLKCRQKKLLAFQCIETFSFNFENKIKLHVNEMNLITESCKMTQVQGLQFCKVV